MGTQPRKRSPSPDAPEFGEVFAALRAILLPYEKTLSVVHDKPAYYYLDTHTIGHNGKPIMFAAVKVQSRYVSYYFMPIYRTARGISPALKKRMQGKACFNFTTVDKSLFKELKALTRQGYEDWKKIEWVE